MSQLAIDATEWRTADWAYGKGLYAGLYEDQAEMDTAAENLARKLASSSPEAMQELKSVFWQGTEHWDTLLEARAEISGRLVLSSFTREAIAQFREKKT